MKDFLNFILTIATLVLIIWVLTCILIICTYNPKDLQNYTWIMGLIDKLRMLWWVNKPVLLMGIGALIGGGLTALWSAWGKK